MDLISLILITLLVSVVHIPFGILALLIYRPYENEAVAVFLLAEILLLMSILKSLLNIKKIWSILVRHWTVGL